jgi:NAD+ synthase (glutamine-hydrolysing)
MKHGFIKLAAAVPQTHVAAPVKNAAEICRLIDRAYGEGVHVLVFPELSVTGYTCGDLFLSDILLDGAEKALETIARHTAGKKMLVFAGCPLRSDDRLYNCAVALSDGEILGITAKTAIPNYGEFYEARHFAPGNEAKVFTLRRGGETLCIPVSAGDVYACREVPDLAVGAEICEDLWVTGSPGETLAANGATVIVNLSASNETVGKDEYRRTLVKAASGKCVAAYVYCDAGSGESTTDTVFSGHSMIAENGRILAENAPFEENELITAVVDVKHLRHDRRKMNTWKSGAAGVPVFSLELKDTDLGGIVDPRPFTPAEGADRDAVCRRILEIQVRGLMKRIKAARADTCVIGLSGGLDSTLALIVTAEAMKKLGRSSRDIIALTMPCFGTTSRTRSNAEKLGSMLSTRFRTVDIKESVDLHFRDIGHDPENRSVVYENAQARERTQILMDIANAENGIVIGTGDLSELALGWATYNGDHMSNYGVNGGVPKTLVRVLVDWYARDRGDGIRVTAEDGSAETLGDVLRDILGTPVSPELLPPKDGEIAQKTEDLVGPYELHDFFLYHYVRWGETPDKMKREATAAFAGTFDEATVDKWLAVFLRRFRTQQFKRSALPDGPKVGSVALSPRGDWRMPSDADAD